MTVSATSCALTYYGVSVKTFGFLAPCCQYPYAGSMTKESNMSFRDFETWKATELRDLRQRLDSGIKDSRCGQCWREEAAGRKSLRLQMNEVYFQQPVEQDLPTRYAEIRLGNFCNLKCIMCTAHSSSAIEAEYLANQDRYRQFGIGWATDKILDQPWREADFMQFMDGVVGQADRILFTGGEPLINPALMTIMQRIPDPERVTLMFVTNLTRIPTGFADLLPRFKKVFLAISLDGVGHFNDYVRSGSRFEDIQTNFNSLSQLRDHVVFTACHTFQNTSAYTLPGLAKWCHDHDVNLQFSPNYYTDYFAFATVPPARLETFRSWARDTPHMTDDNRSFVLNSTAKVDFDPVLQQRFLDYVAMLDSMRGTDYNEIFQD